MCSSDLTDAYLHWCRHHKKEGIVGKTYIGDEQVFFKEKIDLPKRQKQPRDNDKPQYPTLPLDMTLRAIEQALHVVEENGGDKTSPKDAMPTVARYVSTQAREHHYSSPGNLFVYYQGYLRGDYKMEDEKDEGNN